MKKILSWGTVGQKLQMTRKKENLRENIIDTYWTMEKTLQKLAFTHKNENVDTKQFLAMI